jgi:hypothetical protein
MLNAKSKKLYLEHLLFKKLITEQDTSSNTEQPSGSDIETRIINAMKFNKRRKPNPGIPVCKFFYRPPSDPDGGVIGYRDVEIFALGTNRWGNRVIYGWIKSETSKTLKRNRPNDRIRWRMFRLDGISGFKYTIQNFDISDSFLASNRPKLNKLFNKALTNVTTVFDLNKNN